jgi:hypothetical protein
VNQQGLSWLDTLTVSGLALSSAGSATRSVAPEVMALPMMKAATAMRIPDFNKIPLQLVARQVTIHRAARYLSFDTPENFSSI